MKQRTRKYWLRLILFTLVMLGVGALIIIFVVVPMRAADVMTYPPRKPVCCQTPADTRWGMARRGYGVTGPWARKRQTKRSLGGDRCQDALCCALALFGGDTAITKRACTPFPRKRHKLNKGEGIFPLVDRSKQRQLLVRHYHLANLQPSRRGSDLLPRGRQFSERLQRWADHRR